MRSWGTWTILTAASLITIGCRSDSSGASGVSGGGTVYTQQLPPSVLDAGGAPQGFYDTPSESISSDPDMPWEYSTPPESPESPESLLPPELAMPQPAAEVLASEYVAQAIEMLDAGDVDQALFILERAIAENPQIVELHLAVGDIHRKKGDYEIAEATYEKASIVDPASFDAHYYLGLMRQLLGKLLEAVNAYLFALAIEPDNFDANFHLATVYLQLSRPAEAVSYARRSTELNSQHQGAWANLAVTYSLMRLYDKAVDAYRQAAELGELSEPITLGLADAHIKLDNFELAINVLNTQIQQVPSAFAYERLGYACYKTKRYEDAMANFRAALLYDPNHAPALNGLGVSLMTIYIQTDRKTPRQRDEALGLWHKSIQLRPSQAKIVKLIEQFQLW